MNKRQRKKLKKKHLREAEARAAIDTITHRYVRKSLATWEKSVHKKEEASRGGAA